ncbi:MAG: bifunctional [glutamate--ammonia ligase]-adenylyl-L-tyrosine phosphorylase/[glutamate--ammonia-ligase] adenylyltransferase [Deltaproteobacteria bacterium]|nr:bifunctional [glutamate--ammonia ligase]-adenylyl-L-tyrosine phosphorylase/[glutamate--ammonia-ligase] adenylyltransferase [Deltaproteobacteria bacterium]
MREMVRIAWRDLAGWADLSETMADLSDFADACIGETLALLDKQACLNFGIPTGMNGTQQKLIVIGMGKLGARELNFSSDIDLILAYPDGGQTQDRNISISNEEFFIRLSRQLLKVIGQTTADGILFRVDLRLRPYGESGPLVMSFDNMEDYYQNQGREWERYAWIKARVVAGDQRQGVHLLERLKPFVYRRYLDFGTFDSLRAMKQSITLELKSKGMQDHIKLGPGGIREIEFLGQVFQLIRGGVSPVLQERNIQIVLRILAQENYIPSHVCEALIDAYIFLRNTEHRLQEFADQQTHTLPQDAVGRTRLAVCMGFSNWQSFAFQLEKHMETVHNHFNALLKTEDSGKQDGNFEIELAAVWQLLADTHQNKKVLSAAGYNTPDQVLHLLDHLQNDIETRTLGQEGRKRLDRLIPLVLKASGKSENPDMVIHRLVNLIKTIERRTCYLSLLLENPTVLTHLIKLANASPWIISFLARYPVLLDELLDPRNLYALLSRTELENNLRRRLARLPHQDLEQQMEELRIFKQINILRVAAADITGNVPLMKVSDHLTNLAETILCEVLELSWNHLVEKHGRPTCQLSGNMVERGFTVIAYGKLGGIELGYSSDIDLVFLHSGTDGYTQGDSNPIDNAHFFARLGQRVIHILTAHMPAGILYETDMRLRPSGSSGLLVSHVESFKDYQINHAWTWEHQSLVRARSICGDPLVARRFEQIRQAVLARPRVKTKLREEIAGMRGRMRTERLYPEAEVFDLNQGRGGIIDIEFLVQYLVLLNSNECTELLQWTDNVRLLETLAKTGIIDGDTALFLKEAYLTYRSSAHRLSLQEKPARVERHHFHNLRENVKKIWSDLIENEY